MGLEPAVLVMLVVPVAEGTAPHTCVRRFQVRFCVAVHVTRRSSLPTSVMSSAPVSMVTGITDFAHFLRRVVPRAAAGMKRVGTVEAWCLVQSSVFIKHGHRVDTKRRSRGMDKRDA